MDILELPVTSEGSRYVLVIEDYFSKFVNLYALLDQTAHSVAQCLFEDYILLHGIPETVHSDQGRQFEAEIIQRLCTLLDIDKTRTAPYNPKSDGMVERFNRTLIDQLAKSLLSCGGEWDNYLKQVAFAYNTTVHASTGYTPYYLIHGREARVPVDVLVPKQAVPSDLPLSHADFVSAMRDRLEVAFANTRQNAAVAHEKQKLYHDTSTRHQPYLTGDLVWLHNPREDRKKLAPHWRGPFKVLAVLDSEGVTGHVYRIGDLLSDGAPSQVVHYDRLKPYTLGLIPVPSSGVRRCPTLDASSRLGDEVTEVMEAGSSGTVSRAGRAVRPPGWFKNFVSYY
uniref:Integrase catalytic domain-containing protein n=1 Tax=Nothobranchius furzeri TaxID=105023 RepID=A0A8C6P3V4_NOTFU